MGGDKITLQSKAFKDDAKKQKLTHKLENFRNFPKYKKIFAAISILLMMSALFSAKNQK